MRDAALKYRNAVKVFEELMMDLTGKGVEIPGHVIDSIRSGRSYINILLRAHDDGVERHAAISLESAEMNLLSMADASGGSGYADMWQRRINDAYAGIPDAGEGLPAPPAPVSVFAAGVPRGRHFIRIQESELSPLHDELDEMFGGFELIAKTQKDGYILLYGTKENVSSFLKEVRRKIGKKA